MMGGLSSVIQETSACKFFDHEADGIHTTYRIKDIFYSLSNAFDLTSRSTFRANIDQNIFKNMGHPRLSVGESILLIHALQRNFERTIENDGFNMNALEM